jgi:hypothetical protein
MERLLAPRPLLLSLTSLGRTMRRGPWHKLPTNRCAGSGTLMTPLSSSCTNREAGEVSWPSEWLLQEYKIHHGNEDGWPPILSWHRHVRETGWCLGPTHKPFFQHCYSFHDALGFLKTTCRENAYSIREIRRALNPAVRTSKLKDKLTSVTLFPNVQDLRPAQQNAGQTQYHIRWTAA